MTTIELLTEKDEQKWQKFVHNSKEGTICHLLEWRDVLRGTYNYRPFYLIAKDNGTVKGILPLFRVKSFITGNRLVSLPFSSIAGPIATSEEAMRKLIGFAEKKITDLGYNYLELKLQHTLPENLVKESGMILDTSCASFLLELTNDPKDIWTKLHKNSIRRAVNKAIRTSITVRTADTIEDMLSFYNLNIFTRKKHGSPPQSLEFFKSMWWNLNGKEFMKLSLAEYDGKVIAGIILFTFGDTIWYAYGASDDKYLKYRPNNLLLWRAIEWGCINGYKYFDFGRVSPDNRGLMDFKSRWGTQKYKLSYYYYPKMPVLISRNRTSLKYRLMSNFWRKTPVPVSKFLGPHLLKQIG